MIQQSSSNHYPQFQYSQSLSNFPQPASILSQLRQRTCTQAHQQPLSLHHWWLTLQQANQFWSVLSQDYLRQVVLSQKNQSSWDFFRLEQVTVVPRLLPSLYRTIDCGKDSTWIQLSQREDQVLSTQSIVLRSYRLQLPVIPPLHLRGPQFELPNFWAIWTG